MKYQIPFNDKGDQLHYAGYGRVKEEDNYEFEDTLTVLTYARGRSAAYFHLSREDGREVTMFLKDFLAAIPHLYGGKIKGKFTFVKRGANFGCKLLEAAGENS